MTGSFAHDYGGLASGRFSCRGPVQYAGPCRSTIGRCVGVMCEPGAVSQAVPMRVVYRMFDVGLSQCSG